MDYLEKNTLMIAVIILVLIIIIFFFNVENFYGKISNGNQKIDMPYAENMNNVIDNGPPSWNEYEKEHKKY